MCLRVILRLNSRMFAVWDVRTAVLLNFAANELCMMRHDVDVINSRLWGQCVCLRVGFSVARRSVAHFTLCLQLASAGLRAERSCSSRLYWHEGVMPCE